jgi:flagellar hook-associated protein FlgK
MATKQEVLDAVQAEHDQVTAAVNDLGAQIQALKDQIAAGGTVTSGDLDDILTAVAGIFTPAT